MVQFLLTTGAYLDKSLSLPSDKLSLRQAWLLALLAYLFAAAVRCFYPDLMLSNPGNLHNGLPILNNIDGYFFADEANKLLTDHPRASWERVLSSPFLISLLIYALSATGIWHLEQVIYFIPLVFAPLVCLPLVFIGRALGSTWLGFIAALLASVTWSYYNRSLAGYLDTDTFTTTMPMLLCLALLHLLQRSTPRNAVIVGVLTYLYYYAYSPGIAIGLAISGFTLAYLCWRDYCQKSTIAPLILLLLAPTFIRIFDGSMWWAQAAIWLLYALLVAWNAARLQALPVRWQWIGALALSAVCVATSPLVWQIWQQFFGYLNRGVTDFSGAWSYYAVSGTVREAGTIPFEVFANRVAGSVPSYFLAMLSIVVFLLRFRYMAMLLPMAAVGFFALFAGLRFTIYLIPISMLSIAFVVLLLAHKWSNFKWSWLLPAIVVVAVLIPNLIHVHEYRPNITTPKAEIVALEKLRDIGGTRDYMISWWDYGYDTRFFSGKNTIIDGGAHTDDNFLAATILSSDSQLLAARLMRISAETHGAYYDEHGRYGGNIPTKTLFGERRDDFNPHELLEEIAQPDYQLPYQKTREVFLYLPTRILNIYRTIRLFSDLNLVTGQTYNDAYYLNIPVRSASGGVLNLHSGVSLDLRKGEILSNNQRSGDLRAFYHIRFDDSGNIRQESSLYSSQAQLSAVFNQATGAVLLVDRMVLRSNLIQMLLFDNIDQELFEITHRDPEVTILKLLI